VIGWMEMADILFNCFSCQYVEVPLNCESNIIILSFKVLARPAQLTWTLCRCVQRSNSCTFKYECCTEWGVLEASHLKNFSSVFHRTVETILMLVLTLDWVRR
jgi:hypothetical protein